VERGPSSDLESKKAVITAQVAIRKTTIAMILFLEPEILLMFIVSF